MSGEISLVFLGGIADSGKSALKIKLETLAGIEFVSISDYFKDALENYFKLTEKTDGTLRALEYVDWKSKSESKAIELLGGKIQELRRRKGTDDFGTLIVNTHFATYSPGGFMIGLDPPHILQICQYCNLRTAQGQSEVLPGKAAVILVDIAISDVLQRREDQWKENTERSSMGQGLIQDLEFNRLYALHYYNILSQFLGPTRVAYHRVLMDWRKADTHKPIEDTDALKVVFGELREFLKEEQIISGKQK